jgi:phosphatidylinositol alpha-1,6-mannosyltransferase
MMIRRAADSAKIPWGFFLHGRDLIRTANRWQRHPLKVFRWRALSEAAVIITNSRFTADQAVRFGFDGDRIAVVHPEVDTRRFHPPLRAEDKRAIRHRLGLPQDEILTLFVGRLVERKGLADLFGALALVPNARLIVAGAGDASALRERARGAGVTDRVHFAGSPDDEELPVWYRAADIFVAPSVHDTVTGEVEGFGIVFLEAQASGLPVLATRAGGIPEAVQENRTALLVQPADVPALADAWQRLHDDAGLRRSLAESAVLGPPQEHGPGSSARQLATALRRIVGSAVD